MRRKIICALDTGELSEARAMAARLARYAGAFKVAPVLVLQYGLDVVDYLREDGVDCGLDGIVYGKRSDSRACYLADSGWCAGCHGSTPTEKVNLTR